MSLTPKTIQIYLLVVILSPGPIRVAEITTRRIVQDAMKCHVVCFRRFRCPWTRVGSGLF